MLLVLSNFTTHSQHNYADNNSTVAVNKNTLISLVLFLFISTKIIPYHTTLYYTDTDTYAIKYQYTFLEPCFCFMH